MANTIEILIRANDQASRQLAGVENAIIGMGKQLATFKNIATAAVAAAGGVAFLATSFAREVEQLDNAARVSGLTIQQLQILERVTKNQGYAAETLTGSLRFLNREIANNNPLLAKLNITAHEAYPALLQLADAFSKSEDAAAKNKVAMALLGRGGADLIALLDGLDAKVRETAELMDGGMTDAAIAEGKKLDAEIDRFATRWEGFMSRIKAASATGVNAVIDFFRNVTPEGQTAGGRSGWNPTSGFIGPPTEADAKTFWGWSSGAPGTNIFPAEKSGPDPVTAALKERVKTIYDLADAIRTLDTTASVSLRQLPTGNLFTALFGTGPEKAVAGPATFHDFVDRFRQDNAELATIAEAGAFAIDMAFQNAFAGLLDKTQTFASAMKSIFGSLVSSILAALGHLFARFALSALGGLIGGPLGAFIGSIIPASAGRGRAEGAGATYVINALDARSVIQQLQSPMGGMRRGNDRVLYGASY